MITAILILSFLALLVIMIERSTNDHDIKHLIKYDKRIQEDVKRAHDDR